MRIARWSIARFLCPLGAAAALAGCLSTVPDYPPLAEVQPTNADNRVIKATFERLLAEQYRLSLSDEQRVTSIRQEAQDLFERFCADTPIIHQRQEVIGVQGTAEVQVYRHFVQLECDFDAKAANDARDGGSVASFILWGINTTPKTKDGEFFEFGFNDENGAMKLEIFTRAEDHSFWNLTPEKRYFTEDLLADPPWE